jgi:HEAT repeat protein
VRQAAAVALGAIGDARAVEPLIAALKDEDSGVRLWAAKALDAIGWKPETGEAEALYLIAQRKWDGCVKIGAPAVEPLIAALKGEDWRVREAAAEALGKVGDARAVEPLIAALKDGDSDVRKAAAEALAKIGAPAVEPLIAALKGEDWRVREAAAEALVNIYREGRLTEAQRRLILAERPVITKRHHDYHPSCGGFHEDKGIGVPFPF